MYFFDRYFWCQVIWFIWKGFTLKIGKLAPVTIFFCCLYIFRFTFIINCCNILKIFSFFKVSVISGLQFQLAETWGLNTCLQFTQESRLFSWAWLNWILWPCVHLRTEGLIFFFSARVNDRVSYGGSNFWISGRNPVLWSFKWNLFSSTLSWYYLFSMKF